MIKGFPSQEKNVGIITGHDNEVRCNFVTLQPTGSERYSIDTINRGAWDVTAGTPDTAEALTGGRKIVATAHGALVGDIIKFESGANTGKEYHVTSVTTDEIIIASDLGTTLIATDTFSILRPVTPRYDSDGLLLITSGPITFTYNGVTTEVTKDVATPANNRPLPVELVNLSGDLNITAQDLNVSFTHIGANADSTRIGDGVTEWGIKVGTKEGLVSDADGLAQQTLIKTATQTIAGAIAGSEMQVDLVDIGPAATAANQATVIADLVSIDASNATIAGAIAGSEMQVDLVDIGPAATAAKQDTGNTSLSTIAGAIAGSEMQVDLVDLGGAATEAKQDDIITALGTLNAGLDIVDQLDAGVITPSSTTIPKSSSNAISAVASLAADVKKIQTIEDIGEFMALYKEAARTNLICYLPLAGGEVEVNIASGQAVYIGAVNDTDITTDTRLMIQFLG